jgi:4'-phosphopantetheinyl transferase
MAALQSMVASSQDFKLSQNDVHVWCASLLQPAHVIRQMSTLLSSDEQERASRYRFENLQRSFIVARGVLRLLLARYADFRPRDLVFTYLAAGKPQLSKQPALPVFFNLSHSHELVLYAFSRTPNVGIDIEHVRPIDDMELIAERNFSAHEAVELKTLSPEKISEGFFNCWTRKEAYIKAIGNGISFPLGEFDVSLVPGESAKLLSIHGSVLEAERWTMAGLHPAAGYTAALVVEGNVANTVYREWNRLDHFTVL